MAFLQKLFGDDTSRALKAAAPFIARINALEPDLEKLSDVELRGKTLEFKERLGKGESLDNLLPEAFAAIREAAKRTLGQRHFDVQLMGGIALHQGNVAEMKTGEGKTLVATLPAYLNALEGKGVHIVTVNDYLSRRDAAWMGQIYAALGLSVGVINHEASFLYDPAHKELDQARDQVASFKVVYEFLRPCTRQEAYKADITYGTNNEFGFDYLRDNLAQDATRLAQGEHHFAIVDEIDSILIDEARTPLIISGPVAESESLYYTFAKLAGQLNKDKDFTVDEKLRAIHMTDAGISRAEKLLGVENIYTEKGIKYVHHLETAVRAKALFQKDKEYVVKNGEVVIVDEFTGRLQPGRRWSEGLHQAIEAKEGLKIQQESRTYASITFQNYFRLYHKLAGMTGTAVTSAEEFFKVYNLSTIEIPPNKPSSRADQNDLIFQTETGKIKAVVKKIQELNAKGQPVLVGTVSIEKNELLSKHLQIAGVPHEVLNAKNNEKEGEIIAQAGRRGGVTIATNMAGRGVDIKLGGARASPTEHDEVKKLGGLFVLGTERHEARRIDNQLRGRSGRQGDPGETQFFVSLEDSLMRIFASDTIKKMMGRFGIPEDEPIENKLITRSLESAQEKIEGFNFDARKHVLQYDDVLNYQRKIVYERRRKILVGSDEEVKEYIDRILGEAQPEVREAIEKKRAEVGDKPFYTLGRQVALQTVDIFWVGHLETMDYLRGSVNLRAYGQRDPLVEYKKEGLRLFKEMEDSIENQILQILATVSGVKVAAADGAPAAREVHESGSMLANTPQNPSSQQKPATSAQPRNPDGSKIGRNDPCPCGSGKKYKKCHGK